MHSRSIIAGLAALIILSMTGQAFALDAYKDRRGFLLRVGIGGTSSQACGKSCIDRHLGLGLRLHAGVGLNQNTTADFGVRLTGSSGDGLAGLPGDAERNISGLFVGGNYYTDSGAYVRASIGLSNFEEIQPSALNLNTPTVKETGLAYGVEAGFEMFANADWAVAISVDLAVHEYDDGLSAKLLTFGITGTHY